MRKQAKLETLPQEDRQHILQLCATHSYEAAAGILAKPRDQGGLGLSTNRSALCRFAQKHDASVDDRLNPILARLRETSCKESLDYASALGCLLQERIFASLVAENNFDKIRREFEAYLTLKRLNLAERKSIHSLSKSPMLLSDFGSSVATSQPDSSLETARNALITKSP